MRRTLPRDGRLVGVDLGEVRVGLAVTDGQQRIATPRRTVEVTGDVDEVVAAVVRALDADPVGDEVAGLVVGYPRSLAGREEAAGRRARRIAELLTARTGLPHDLWDERFTTVEAERVMLAQDASRRRRRESIDRVAATLILQGYLDARRRTG